MRPRDAQRAVEDFGGRFVKLALLMLLSAPAAGQEIISVELRAAMASSAPHARLHAYAVLADQLAAEDVTRQVAGLHGKERRAAVSELLRRHASLTQEAAYALLAQAVVGGQAGRVDVLWMGNALIFEAQPSVIEALSAIPGVDRIRLVAHHGPEAYEDALPATESVYPFYDDFESGQLQPAWTVFTTGAGEVTVTGADGPLGNYHLEMDSGAFAVEGMASITLALDLTGQSGVGLRFQSKSFFDEDDDEDGVFISDDGISWIKALGWQDGSSTYETYAVELDPIVAEAGMHFGPDFRVRFQWKDDFPIPTDGLAFDNIEIAPGVGKPILPPPEPNLVALQAPELWSLGVDGHGVLLGTIDTGVWIGHPDLVHRIWVNPDEVAGNGVDDDDNGMVDDVHGWNFTYMSPEVADSDGHGTATAGLACGDGSGGVKLTGMAPGAMLLVCSVFFEADYWLAQQYCLAMGVDCITSSLSYKWLPPPKPDYHMHRQMCSMELAAGIVHANSIGNQGSELATYAVPFNISTPGNCPSPFDYPALVKGGRSSILACGGIEFPSDASYTDTGHGPSAWEDMKKYTPSYGWPQDPQYWDYPYGGFFGGMPGLVKPDLVAYATNVQTTSSTAGEYMSFSGTSAAAPHLGGALCLLLDSQPEAEPRHLAAALELTAADLGVPGKDNLFGSGKIQVKDAARRLVVLGRFTDPQPPVGGSTVLDLFGPPHSTVFWLASLATVDDGTDFNLAPPFFIVSGSTLDQSGHLAIPLSVPSDPGLSGLTLWSQFTTKGVAPVWGSARFWSVPEELNID